MKTNSKYLLWLLKKETYCSGSSNQPDEIEKALDQCSLSS